jgi:hypothetical protein
MIVEDDQARAESYDLMDQTNPEDTDELAEPCMRFVRRILRGPSEG